MITSFHDLHILIQGRPRKRVALVAAEDQVLIEVAAKVQEEGLADFTLLGSGRKLENMTADLPQTFKIIDSQDPARAAIDLIRNHEADLLMKGKIATGELLRAVLDRDHGLRQGELMNHIAVIESPHYHKLLFISDGGINLKLDEKVFIQMIRNNAHYLKKLCIDAPKFSMLALVETVNDKIPETLVAQNVVKVLTPEFNIEGPMAPDVALSAAAAAQKGQPSSIAGDVDVFMMPNTTAANHLVKGLMALGGCIGGGVIVGAQVPIILLSRSDDADTRYRSVLLGLI